MIAVLAKLRLHSQLTRASEEAVETLIRRPVRRIERRRDLFRVGDRPRTGFIVIEGSAVRQKSLRDGRRQTTAILLPGDIIDLHSYLTSALDDTVTAITPLTVAAVSKDQLEYLTDTYPDLTEAFLWEQLVETAIDREWVLNVGQRDATERLAHLLCEILIRLRIVGRSDGRHCDFPLTQTHLGEITGLTPVHVNRVLKILREEQLIALSNRKLAVTDLPALMKRGLFDPGYLHLESNEQLLTAV